MRGVQGVKDDTQAIEFVSPDDRIWYIARGVMKEKQLEKSDFLNEGGRHTSVKIFLSGATQLLTKAETNAVLAELMPEHWQDKNIQQLVDDFYKNYTSILNSHLSECRKVSANRLTPLALSWQCPL